MNFANFSLREMDIPYIGDFMLSKVIRDIIGLGTDEMNTDFTMCLPHIYYAFVTHMHLMCDKVLLTTPNQTTQWESSFQDSLLVDFVWTFDASQKVDHKSTIYLI